MLKSKTALSTCASVAAAIVLLLATAAPQAQQRTAAASKVTSPQEQFGHNIGDDYYLVNYTQYLDYLKKMDAQSERMVVVDIGKTEEGRSEVTAIITSPENHRKLPLIKEANRKLALADGLNDEQARQLAPARAKPSSGSTAACTRPKCSGAQQLIETIHRLNTEIRSGNAAHPERHRSSSARWSIPTGWSWCRTGTCATRTRRNARPAAFRGSTRSTSATTTTATST